MPGYFFIASQLLQGKTMVRTVLDYRLKSEQLSGTILDLGSGGSTQYSDHIPRTSDASIQYFDQKVGQETNFESDVLPAETGSFDTVLFLNVLEHIYNYRHITKEIHRIKKPDGRLVGFVPFLKWYHADPQDFFRYTHESLEKIFAEAGYTSVSIEPLYIGPYATAFDMILPTVPRVLRPIFYLPCGFLDALFRKLRPKAVKRYALGYYFVCQ